MSPLPTKLLMSWEDIGTDHPDVPASCFTEWEEAKPENLQAVFFWFKCIIAAIWFLTSMVDFVNVSGFY